MEGLFKPMREKGVTSFSFPLVSMLSLWAKREKTLYSPAYSLSISNTLTLLSCLFQNHRLLPTKIHHSFMHPVLFDPNSTDKILFDPNSLPPKSYYIIKKIKKTSVFCIFLTPYLITIVRM